MTWEIDVWGRIRRLTESARAELFSNEETRRAVFITVIADVATAYFQLRSWTSSSRFPAAPSRPANGA